MSHGQPHENMSVILKGSCKLILEICSDYLREWRLVPKLVNVRGACSPRSLNPQTPLDMSLNTLAKVLSFGVCYDATAWGLYGFLVCKNPYMKT